MSAFYILVHEQHQKVIHSRLNVTLEKALSPIAAKGRVELKHYLK